MADATAVLNEIFVGLDGLANHVAGMHPSDSSMMEMWGWNMPGMTFNDLADFIRQPKEIISKIDNQSINDADLQRLRTFPQRIQWVLGNVVPQLPGGNAANAFVGINGLIQSILQILRKYDDKPLEFKSIEDKQLLPAAQIKELKKMESGIQRLMNEAGNLEQKITLINSAHSVAQALPADIQSLEDARSRYEAATNQLSQTFANIEETRSEIEKLYKKLSESKEQAENVLVKANSAYSAATTVGLGAAFADRAKVLSDSTWTLGGILLVTLSLGAFITYQRVEFVHKLMLSPNISYGILWINVTFTALSVSAPIWFAWLLTRQIGQRFRLAEDYGYKASVAKAYEGYRKEAAQIDAELGKKLFAIALDKLGEAPLRLVEKESPGSPIHDVHGKITGFLPKKISAEVKAPTGIEIKAE